MIHDSVLFEFPGRGRELRRDVDDAAAVHAVRLCSLVVEPSVVDSLVGDAGEPQAYHHLVSRDRRDRDGDYIRAPERTTEVSHIDEAALAAWLPTRVPIAQLSIRYGWYFVDARPGDVLRLADRGGAYELPVVERPGGAAIVGPTEHVLTSPVSITIDGLAGELRIAVHWSAWATGIGRSRVDRMTTALAEAGWVTVRRPRP